MYKVDKKKKIEIWILNFVVVKYGKKNILYIYIQTVSGNPGQ